MSQTFSVSQQANWSWSSRWRSMRVACTLECWQPVAMGEMGNGSPQGSGYWHVFEVQGGESFTLLDLTQAELGIPWHLSSLISLISRTCPHLQGFHQLFLLFIFFFSDTLLLADHFSGEPFCWASSSFCNLRSLVFKIPLVCACSLSLLVVLSRLFNNWICHSYRIQALSKFATSSY